MTRLAGPSQDKGQPNILPGPAVGHGDEVPISPLI